MTTPDPADVHAGATSEQLLTAYRTIFDAVTVAAADRRLRPTAVEVHAQLGLVDCSVYFPTNDVPAVDALAQAFSLPPALDDPRPGAVFYVRTGMTDLDGVVGTLTVRTVRPGVDLSAPAPAAAARPVEAPVVITGELAPVPAPAPAAPVLTIVPAATPAPAPAAALPTRRELIPADPR